MGFGGGRGGGRGGGARGYKRPFQSDGFDQNKRGKFQVDLNPYNLIQVGTISHVCENKFVCKITCDGVPMFNSAVFLENKTHIGKADEIFGQVNSVLMSVEAVDTIKPDSLEKKTGVYMDSSRMLAKEKFTLRPPLNPLEPKKKRPKQLGGGGAQNFKGFGRGRGGARGGGRGRGSGPVSRGGFNNSAGTRGGFNNAGGGRGGGHFTSRGGRGAGGGRGGFGGRGR